MGILNYISTIANLATLMALGFAIYTYKKDKEHDRKRETLEAYNRLQNEVFDEIIKYKKKDICDIAKHYRQRNDEYRKLSTYMAKIEHFCVGVESNIYDVKIVYELGHGFFDERIREEISPLLERKRSFAEHDPYENTKKVFEKMDRIAKRKM